MKAKFSKIVIVIIGILLVVNLVRSFQLVTEKSKVIGEGQNRLFEEQARNDKLKRELAKVESREYIEKNAREKLNLGKEGEYVVILPPMTPMPTPTVGKIVSNPEAWMKVFW